VRVGVNMSFPLPSIPSRQERGDKLRFLPNG
jgi:hypothetical protein